MNKKIVSIFLLALLVVSFAVPVYADSKEANSIEIPQTDPQVQAVNEAIERLDLSTADISEETVIEALEAEGISASADIFAYVYDFAGLEAALADPGVSIILLLADIQMEYELSIDRDISMSGVMGSTIASSADQEFHFRLYAESFQLSNVTIDGGGISGGVYINNSGFIKGAVVQNCLNNYGAVTIKDHSAVRSPLADEMSAADVLPEAYETFNGIILEDCMITHNLMTGVFSGPFLAMKNCDVSYNEGDGISSYSLQIENSTINNNTARGIAFFGGTGLLSNTDIVYNLGGGLYLGGYTDIELENVNVSWNIAEFGGGAYLSSSSSTMSISGGTFEGNTADVGGAFYVSLSATYYSDGSINYAYADLSNMLIKDNYASSGGGIALKHSNYNKLTVNENVTFSGNTADVGYNMTDEEDIAIHDTHVFTTHFSEPFTQYAYNNFDISYQKGDVIEPVTASFYLRYSDAEPYETTIVYAGQVLGDKLPDGPEQSGLKFMGWVDINGISYGADTIIVEDVKLYPAYILD